MQIRNRVRELRLVKASELLPHPNNWRKHPRAQAEALRGLLREIGYADALLARETADGRLQLIDGHLRAETTPNARVPVLVLNVSEEEAGKILATLDPLASMAEVDAKRFEELLSTVRTESGAVAELLERVAGEAAWQAVKRDSLHEAPEPQIDKAAELELKWGTKRGQVWRVGPHRLVCGDCRERSTVERLWIDGGPKLRLIWTDPPYGVDYAGKNAYLNRTDRGNRIQKPIANDQPAGVHALLANALEVAREWAHQGAACYATVPSGPLLPGFIDALNKSGFTFRHLLVWVKQQFVIGMSDYHYRHEPILYGWLDGGAHYWAGSRSQDSVFEVDKPHLSERHPTEKPTELVMRMIANSSRPTEVVFDPFSGSGTTLAASEQLGRVGFGVEIDPGYIAVTLERLAAMGLEPELGM
jgi:DNA modification methylase